MTALSAQTTTGTIIGTITVEQGTPAGVQVTVKNAATGFNRSVLTGENGRFIMPGLETGTYEVSTMSVGFAASTRTVTVALGQATRVDFNLSTQAVELGGITVTAASATGLISPTRNGVLTTISDTALDRLPTLDRNFTDFVALTPQVSTLTGLSGGGVNNRFNQIQIDGTNETDMFGLGSTGQPGGQADGKSIGIEAVKEYQVLLAPFDVRHGNFAGLLVNAVTKSGTNTFHGSIYGTGRNQSFTRSQDYIADYKLYQYGFSLGGPIVKDKVLFFANAEQRSYSMPTGGIYEGNPNFTVSSTDINAAKAVLDAYGVSTGSAGPVTLQRPTTNIFTRLDFPSLPHNSSLVLRYNYGHAVSETLSRGNSGIQPTLALTSNQYQYASTKNAPALELRTNFQSGAFNELRASYTRIRDPRTASDGKRTAQVTVDIPGATLIAGTERYSQGNEVNQDIVELVDNLTLPLGAHTVTFGTQNEIFKAHNLYAQSTAGVWSFDSLDSLRNGEAYQYIIGVPAQAGTDGSVNFTTTTLAGYVQDQWQVTPNFNLTYGIRADIPSFSDKPPTNPDIVTDFGRNTADIPSGHVQISPRVGFNWDMTGDQRNQLRGGIGSFVGHTAYVWMSNAFQNSGLTGVNLLTCTRTAPTFNAAAVANPPEMCTNGYTARAGGEIDLLDPSMRMPQTLRASLGYDRDLGHNLIATVEGLYTRSLYAPFYYNAALAGVQGTDPHGRVLYGLQADKPVLAVSGRSAVYDVRNENKDYGYNLTGTLTRRFADGWEGSASYTYSRVFDVQSLTSSTAASNWKYGRVWAGDQMDQSATRSSFEQRHRIVAHASYTFSTNTTLSFVYQGGSGNPYGFVTSGSSYRGDLNGDYVQGNDPIYIPKNATDPNEMVFKEGYKVGSTTYSAAQQAQLFEDFISSNKCLDQQRGHIMERNSCVVPWQNLLNLNVRQSLKDVTGKNVEVQLDVFNFLNLVNKDWGHQGGSYSDVNLLYVTGFTGGDKASLADANNKPIYQYDPTQYVVNYQNLASNYQLQLQLRYRF